MGEELSAFAKNRKSTKLRRYLLLAILLIALLGTATYLLLQNFFVVKSVASQRSEIYKTADIIECAAIKKGTPLHKVDREKIAKKIEDRFPYLEEVKLENDLPNKIKISFREEYGKFYLALGQDVFAVDDKLFVLAKENGDSGIERIEIKASDVKRCVVGESLRFLDEDTSPILLSLIKTLNEKGMVEKIRSIDVTNQFDIRLDYDARFEIAMGDHLDMELKMAMVQEILKDRDLQNGATGSIDISDSDQAYLKLND